MQYRSWLAVGLAVGLGGALGDVRRPELAQVAVSCESMPFACSVVPWSAGAWSARGSFDPLQNETGWGRLVVETNAASRDDAAAAFGAGWIEGYLTAEPIGDIWRSWLGNSQLPTNKVKGFITAQKAFLDEQIAAAAGGTGPEAHYWQHVGLTYFQLQGMAAGYSVASKSCDVQGPPCMSEDAFTALNWQMELEDIGKAVDQKHRPKFEEMAHEDFSFYVRKNTHCSALFRVTPDLSDIFAAHTTWCDYAWMLRMFKVYELRYSTAPAQSVVFTGYPALLASSDDFIVTDQRLVITETSNSVFNNSLYDFVVPRTVPYFIRCNVASRLATSAKDWHDIFYRWNSGTYNNQWVVLDYKKFTPRQPLLPWTFVVSEQLPGPFSHPADDQTVTLQRGHWPSYNIPYFEDVYTLSGYPGMVETHGLDNSYQLTPRAPIFRRQADGVNSLEDMQHFMRFNSYGHGDKLAKEPTSAIASREDLKPVGGHAMGAIDGKVVNAALVAALEIRAISGPTTEGHEPFKFQGQWASHPHFGMPEVYNFSWLTLSMKAEKAKWQEAGPHNIVEEAMSILFA